MKKERITLKELITWALLCDFIQVKLDEILLASYKSQLEKVLLNLDKEDHTNPPND